MKRFLFSIFTVMLMSVSVNAQSELSFNQAILLSNTQVVPTGKVWKIVSCLQSCSGFCSSSIEVNGNTVWINAMTNGAPGFIGGLEVEARQTTNLPIWLPEGTEVGGLNNIHYVSILEFNM